MARAKNVTSFHAGIKAIDRAERAKSPVFDAFRGVVDDSTHDDRRALARLILNAERTRRAPHKPSS